MECLQTKSTLQDHPFYLLKKITAIELGIISNHRYLMIYLLLYKYLLVNYL